METKICSKCGIEKDKMYFSKNTSACKLCVKKYKKDYYQNNKDEVKENTKTYYQNNKDKRKEYINNNKETIKKNRKEYRDNNKNAIKEYQKEYHKNNKEIIKESKKESQKEYYQNNKEVIKEKVKKYRKNNYEKIKEYHKDYEKERLKNDPAFKLRRLVSSSIRGALKLYNSSKIGESCLKYLNYNIEDLKFHIENQFESWMTWQNWGNYNLNIWNDNDQSTWTWQIDHIIPQSDLPYIFMEDDNFKKCWNLDNLRPYSAKQNILDGTNRIRHKKGNK